MHDQTHTDASVNGPDDDYERAAEWLDVMADGPLDELSQRRFAQWLNAGNQRRVILERMLVTWEDAALSSAAERYICLLYTSPSPRDRQKSRMPSSA